MQEIEAALVKKDIEHAKLKAAHNVPAAVAKNLALNDPTMQRKRGRMMLPAPQISEAELEVNVLPGTPFECRTLPKACKPQLLSQATRHLDKRIQLS